MFIAKKYDKISYHEVVSELFAPNATVSSDRTLNSCSGAFRSVSVHLAIFHYYTELGAKWVELVQLRHKFVP